MLFTSPFRQFRLLIDSETPLKGNLIIVIFDKMAIIENVFSDSGLFDQINRG